MKSPLETLYQATKSKKVISAQYVAEMIEKEWKASEASRREKTPVPLSSI